MAVKVAYTHADLVKLCKNTANRLKALKVMKTGNGFHSNASSFVNYYDSNEERNSNQYGRGCHPYSRSKGKGKGKGKGKSKGYDKDKGKGRD